MEPELRDLLRTVAIDPVGDSHTHVSLYGPHARWTIRPHTQTNFWTGYCDLVDRKTNGREGVPPEPFTNMCLAERPQEVMPEIAKLTFRFHTDAAADDNWEPYEDEFLQHLCNTYQTVLSEYFRITSDTQMELVVAVLESTTHWYEEDRDTGQRFMVMEVRLQFPYGRIDSGMQNRLVRPRVIQLLRNNNVMAKMQRQPVGDWEQIISTNTINEPVIMYGGCEVQGRPKLELTHIWPNITRDMLDSGMQPEEIPLEDAFVPQNHANVQQQAVNAAIFEDGKRLTYWMPMFLSLGYWPTVLLPKEEVNDNGRFTTQLRMMNIQPEQQRVFGVGNRTHDDAEQSDMELAERMIPMINPQRFLREAFWLDIGRALYIADEGGDNGLRSWTHHTERALAGAKMPDYMTTADNLAETCRNLYYTFANSSTTFRTLAWYAREDSPDRYANWHRDWCMASMEQALSGYHTDVAIALHRVYWLDFVYCPIGKGKWFQFRNHRWFEVNQGIALRRAISRDFMKRFEAARMVLSRQIHDSNDDAFKGNAEITMKKITTLIGKLKTVAFKSSIMTEACEHFNNDQFMNLLDTNPDLTGVTNGILEASGHHVQFRHAKPEDYISMCTNIPYHSNYSWNHPLVQECMKWFGQVFTDRSLLHHFLKFSASCLKGLNSDKIFPIFTGEGDNSKSMIVKLFEATFNSYCIKFDISNVMSRNGNAAGPTPQLARARATRVAFMDEPPDDLPMHKETIKRWVGGDAFFARMLQDNGGDVKVTFKLILTCNKVPIIPNADKAIKNRTRLFPFMATWVDNPPEDEMEQYRQRRFKKNPFFERRIPILAPAFLWIMSQYYPHYSTEGLTDPAIVTETTEAYWRDNDIYAQFAADTIQEVYTEGGDRDAGARVTLSEIYSEFKTWFRDAFPGTKVPERSIVRSELSSRWGRMHGNAWHGIRVMTIEGPTNMTAALGGRGHGGTAPNAPGKAGVTGGNNPIIIAPTANINTHTQPVGKLTEAVNNIPPNKIELVVTGKPPTTRSEQNPDPKRIFDPTTQMVMMKPVSPQKTKSPDKNPLETLTKPLTPTGPVMNNIPIADTKPVAHPIVQTPTQRMLGLPVVTVAI
ncbi:D5 DNA Primase [uncultured virus]|nr:D5 DNA Primase [uncultured virus]